jgi:pimeloyl-ACP methyl ester carboxylesterase
MNQSTSTGKNRFSCLRDVTQPTVVFIHGFLDDGHTWNEVAADLPWESVAVELGEGDATTLEGFVDHVIAIVDDRVSGDVVLIGQSMGCQVAELVSVRRPDRVSGLVLLTPVPLQGITLPPEMAELIRGCGEQPQAQRKIRTLMSADLPEHKLQQLIESGMRLTAAEVAAAFDAWSGGHPDGAKPTRARAPIQIIGADRDPVITTQLLDDLIMPRFPGASPATITSSGHWPHVEQPAQVVEAVSRFVAKSVL